MKASTLSSGTGQSLWSLASTNTSVCSSEFNESIVRNHRLAILAKTANTDQQEIHSSDVQKLNSKYASRNGTSIRMGYVVCVSDAGRWVWDFWVENPPEAPQVIYKAACVDFKLQ
jgi:hypothetical protein